MLWNLLGGVVRKYCCLGPMQRYSGLSGLECGLGIMGFTNLPRELLCSTGSELFCWKHSEPFSLEEDATGTKMLSKFVLMVCIQYT